MTNRYQQDIDDQVLVLFAQDVGVVAREHAAARMLDAKHLPEPNRFDSIERSIIVKHRQDKRLLSKQQESVSSTLVRLRQKSKKWRTVSERWSTVCSSAADSP